MKVRNYFPLRLACSAGGFFFDVGKLRNGPPLATPKYACKLVSTEEQMKVRSYFLYD